MDPFSLLREGGPIMPIILLTALVGYVLAFERLMVWGYWHVVDGPLNRAVAPGELRGLLKIWADKSRLTPIAALLLRAAALAPFSPEQREQAMHVELLSRLPQVNTRISTIGWLGGILPMLGLLGTVSGMIATFKDLALTTSRQVLSQGLSEALWTTEVGLLAALPLLATHHLLSRLQSRWMDRLEFSMALLFQNQEPKRRGKSQAASPPPRVIVKGRAGSNPKNRARAVAKDRAVGKDRAVAKDRAGEAGHEA